MKIMHEEHEDRIVCPLCGFDSIHFGEVSVSVAPDDDYVVDRFTFARGFERSMGAKYKPEIERGLPIKTRGGSVAIGFWCEGCGGAWREWLSFHKGRIYVGNLILDQATASEWSGYSKDDLEEVWVDHSEEGRAVRFWSEESLKLLEASLQSLREIAHMPHGEAENKAVTFAQNVLDKLREKP